MPATLRHRGTFLVASSDYLQSSWKELMYLVLLFPWDRDAQSPLRHSRGLAEKQATVIQHTSGPAALLLRLLLLWLLSLLPPRLLGCCFCC